jgi:cytoskeleton protein RodZ
VQPIGEALRSAREACGATIADAATATRIRASHLEALEREEFTALGGAVYVKGFLRSYATWLGLDPAPLVAAFRAGHGEDAKPPVMAGGLRPIEPGFGGFGRRRRPSWLVVGSLLAGLVLAAGVLSLASPGGADDPPRVAVPTTGAGAGAATQTSRAATTTTARAAGVQVVMAYQERSWTRVEVDGQTEFEGTPEGGERRTFQGRERVEVTLGNAGAVQLTVNGDRRGPAGAPGQVARDVFTVDGRRS